MAELVIRQVRGVAPVTTAGMVSAAVDSVVTEPPGPTDPPSSGRSIIVAVTSAICCPKNAEYCQPEGEIRRVMGNCIGMSAVQKANYSAESLP